MTKRSKNFGFVLPGPEEEAAIAKGIGEDGDGYAVPADEIARMRPRGRPRLAYPKTVVTMRIDSDVVEALKASGPGWQTRVNQLLKEAVKAGRL